MCPQIGKKFSRRAASVRVENVNFVGGFNPDPEKLSLPYQMLSGRSATNNAALFIGPHFPAKSPASG
jgi:hypothetical protein